MPPGADVTVAARHPLRTFHRLAQRPHGARHGRPDGLRRHAVPVFETGKETFRRLPDRSRSRHSGLRTRIHDGRERGDQQKEEYEDRCFHSVRKYPYHKFSTNPEDKQVRGGFLSIHFNSFQFISGRRSDEAVLRPRPAMQASRTAQKRPGNPGPESMDCVYLRTLTMILRTVPSPTIGACPSSGKSTVNCPGRIV